MLPANLSNALKTLARADKSLVTSEASVGTAKLTVGQQVRGTVVARLNSGLFNISVAGEMVQMRLPAQTRTGAVLDLRVVSTTPQLALSLLPSSHPVSTQEQIGATARFLADLANLPGKRAPVQQMGDTAVWAARNSVPDSKQLASALRAALANSGLFYESHQAEWVQGGRSTTQLLVEPQNRLLDILPKTSASPNKSMTEQLPAALSTANSEANKAAAQTLVAKELLPLVQQQLHAMETHQLTWIGQVWPEQQMQWEIQGEEPHVQSADEEARRWRTELELALPKLGDVHAKLIFSAQGLELRLQSAHPATLQLFERAMPRLREALARSDITLSSALVEKT